jgi:uncharacterized protein (DUF1330 family)
LKHKEADMNSTGSVLAICLTAGLPFAGAHARTGPKAYVVNEIQVTDPAAYKKYADQAPATFAAFGGRFITRGGKTETFEGAGVNGKVVILEFPSWASAKAWHDSPEYQRILAIRNAASVSRVYVIEGLLQ